MTKQEIDECRNKIIALLYLDKGFNTHKLDDYLLEVSDLIEDIFEINNEEILKVSDNIEVFKEEDFFDSVYMLQTNFSREKLEDVKKIGTSLFHVEENIPKEETREKTNFITKIINKIKNKGKKII